VVLIQWMQVKYPENFFLLRGNHECASINRIYGFYDECKRRYNIRLWKTFTDCFNCLPVAALVDEKVSSVNHGSQCLYHPLHTLLQRESNLHVMLKPSLLAMRHNELCMLVVPASYELMHYNVHM